MNEIRPRRWPSVETSLIGRGLYAPAEASRLVGIPAATLRRWLRGYQFGGEETGRWSPPLWASDVKTETGELYLGFRDLIEARVVQAFLTAGASLQSIRKAILLARAAIDDCHPLSTARFRTDGKSFFLEVAESGDEEDAKLIDLFKAQYAFKRVLDPALSDVEFAGGVPAVWKPWRETPRVVIDPARAFGQPIDGGTGVPTAVLALSVKAEGSPEAAAKAFEVPLEAVKHAVAFERRLAA